MVLLYIWVEREFCFVFGKTLPYESNAILEKIDQMEGSLVARSIGRWRKKNYKISEIISEDLEVIGFPINIIDGCTLRC